MSDLIDKKKVTIDEAVDSKSLKKLSDAELDRMLQTLLTTENDNDVTVNILIAELLKRGVPEEKIKEAGKEDAAKEDKIKKAFESLGL